MSKYKKGDLVELDPTPRVWSLANFLADYQRKPVIERLKEFARQGRLAEVTEINRQDYVVSLRFRRFWDHRDDEIDPIKVKPYMIKGKALPFHHPDFRQDSKRSELAGRAIGVWCLSEKEDEEYLKAENKVEFLNRLKQRLRKR